MQFSPHLLLRQPVYSFSNLDAFAANLNEKLSKEHIEELRTRFLSFLKSEHLLLSLPFSSKVLYQAIPHYEFHAAVKIRKKEKQNERAFIKYLMRMALNASPLAAFATTQFCQWDGKLEPSAAKFNLRLSLAQRKEFFDLCYCDTGLQGLMRHRLNPSLQKIEKGFTYILMEDGEQNAVQIETDAQFNQLYNDLVGKDFTFSEFVESCEYDVNEFLEAQLICPSYPIYSDHKLLSEIIESINSRNGLEFALSDIVEQNLDELDAKEVLRIQAHWVKQLTAYAEKLEVTLNEKVYPERLYYLSSAHAKLNKPKFDQDRIGEESLRLVSLIENCRITQIVESTLDKLHDPVEIKPPAYDFDKIELVEVNKYVFRINLENEKIAKKNLGIMLYHTEMGRPYLVNVTTPSGKFFASSLGLANEEVKQQLSDWVCIDSENKVVLKDASLHSKNVGHSFLAEQDNFGLDYHTPIEKRVRLSNQDGKLVNDKSGDVVELVNLGIESVNERSTLFQNLYKLSIPLPNVPFFVAALQAQHESLLAENVRVRPQIETEYLVLGRKTWVFTSKVVFGEYESGLELVLPQINIWRQQYDIPRFISVIIDEGRSNFLDFHNPWSVDNFLRSLKNMTHQCIMEDLGMGLETKGKQIVETYFELRSE